MKYLLTLLSLTMSAASGYAFWVPIRYWAYGLLPTGHYAGLWKLAATIGIGYFGGIAIPIAFFILAVVFFTKEL